MAHVHGATGRTSTRVQVEGLALFVSVKDRREVTAANE